MNDRVLESCWDYVYDTTSVTSHEADNDDDGPLTTLQTSQGVGQKCHLTSGWQSSSSSTFFMPIFEVSYLIEWIGLIEIARNHNPA